MASVKWLMRIQAVREPFRGYWQTSDYGYWDELDGKPVRRTLGEMKLKSEIVRPRIARDAYSAPAICDFRRCVGRRNRGNRDRGKHGRWADLGGRRIPRRC